MAEGEVHDYLLANCVHPRSVNVSDHYIYLCALKKR